MNTGLEGRTVLITGATKGIGKAIAHAFAEEHAHIIICARNKQNLEELEGALLKRGAHDTSSHSLDALNPQSIREMFAVMNGQEERIDVLVNNVGDPAPFGDFFTLTDDDWDFSYNVNLMSMVRITREAIPILKRSSAGRIINISSMSAVEPGMFNPHYIAAKSGMIGVGKYLSRVLAKDKILVNTICPGTLTGDAWERNIKDRAGRSDISEGEARQLMETEEKKKVPLGIMGAPEDVAELVVFLASDKARFITGECFRVDGGRGRSI